MNANELDAWLLWSGTAAGTVALITVSILVVLWIIAWILLPLIVLSLHGYASQIRKLAKRQNELLAEINAHLKHRDAA